jgi:hypothetical protein
LWKASWSLHWRYPSDAWLSLWIHDIGKKKIQP